MPPQILDVPMGGGLAQRTADPHIPAGEWKLVQNLRQSKNLQHSKRPGNVKLTKQYQLPNGGGPANIDASLGGALSAYRDQLLLTTNAGVTNYQPVAGTFAPYRYGSEALLTRKNLPLPQIVDASGVNNTAGVRQNNDYASEPAFCTDGTHYFFTWSDGAGNAWLSVQDIATGDIVRDRVPWTTLSGHVWVMPLFVGGQLVILDLTSGGNLSAYTLAAPFTGAVSGSTLLHSGVSTALNFDACVVGSNFAVTCFVSPSMQFTLYTAAGVPIIGNSIPATAPLEVRTAYTPGQSLVWFGRRETASNQLFLTPLNSSTFAYAITGHTFSGATTVNSFALLPYSTNQCVVAITTGASVQQVEAGVFDATASAGAGAFVVPQNQNVISYASLASRPFLQGGKVYAWVNSYADVSGVIPTSRQWGSVSKNFFSNVLMDLRIDSGVTFSPTRPVAQDSPRFSYPAGNRVLVRAGMSGVSATVSPLSIAQPSVNAWAFISGTRQSSVLTTMSMISADFQAPQRWKFVTIGTLALQASGLVGCWDGEKYFESGFLTYAITATTVASSAGGGGLTNPANYYYRVVPMFLDAAGNIHRGPPSSLVSTGTLTGNTNITLTWAAYQITDKNYYNNNIGISGALLYPSSWEVYRSQPGASGLTDVATNLVDVIANSPIVGTTVSYKDGIVDSIVGKNELCYTFGGALPNVSPPGALDIVAHQGRVWIISDDQSTLYFTKQIVDGEAVNFTDSFLFPTDVICTALASMDDKLIVFGEREIYYLQGEGPPDNGIGGDYGVLERIQSDVGCIDRRSVLAIPEGVLFQSHLGYHLLTRGLEVVYLGQPIADELKSFPVVTSAVLHPSQPWVYITVTDAAGSTGERIVYDYRVQKWYVDTLPVPAISATRVSSDYYWLDSTGQVWKEDPTVGTDDSVYVQSKLVTGHLRPGTQLQGYFAFNQMQLLYTRSSSCDIRITSTLDYKDTHEQQEQIFWDKELKTFELEQLGIATRQREVESIQITIQDVAPVPPDGSGGSATVSDGGFGVTYFGLSMSFEGTDSQDGLFDLLAKQIKG